MHSTRKRILDYLGQRGSASANQLATVFGMTQANVRHHLAALVNDGLIRAAGAQKDKGRGRPRRLFALSEESEQNNLAALASILMVEISKENETDVETKLRDLAGKMIGTKAKPGAQISQRLVATVRKLAPLGYKPHWEARPKAPEMVFGHCPYAAIIDKHPELCRMDAYMLEDLLGAPAKQTAKLQTGPHGLPICIFKVTQNVSK